MATAFAGSKRKDAAQVVPVAGFFATRAAIQQAVRRIVERFNPQKVLLFGSHAYGHPTQDSDVDLLVIMDTMLSNVEQAVKIRQEVDLPFPTDLLVRTPRQMAERLAIGDVFLREVVSKGVVLYEAGHSGMD